MAGGDESGDDEDDVSSTRDSSSLELAMADLELLQAAFPDEIEIEIEDATTSKIDSNEHSDDDHEPPRHRQQRTPPSFPLTAILHFSSRREKVVATGTAGAQVHHDDWGDHAYCQLQMISGYPTMTNIQVLHYHVSNNKNQDEERMKAAVAALRATAQECLEDGVEGSLACCSAALQTWNDWRTSSTPTLIAKEATTTKAIHNKNIGTENDIPTSSASTQKDQHNDCGDDKDTTTTTVATTNSNTIYQWTSTTNEPVVDRKSVFIGHVCPIDREADVRPALDQLLTSTTKLQRATHHMVRTALTVNVYYDASVMKAISAACPHVHAT